MLPSTIKAYLTPQEETISHFVATNKNGNFIYGSFLRYCENLDKKNGLFIPKALCVLSSHPLYGV